MQKPFRIPRPRIRIDRDRPSSPRLPLGRKVERPEELRHGEEEVALGEVDAGADAAAGAVAVVVALFEVGRGGVVRGEEGAVGVAGRVEGVGVRVAGGVVVEGPDVQDDGAAFGDAHAFDRVVWSQISLAKIREKLVFAEVRLGWARERDEERPFSYPHS